METVTVESLEVRIGVDIGQRIDPTAIVAVEVQRRDYEPSEGEATRASEYHYVARHLERLPLGTSYPDVVARVVEIRGNLAKMIHDGELEVKRGRVHIWADATGVGQPVIDLLDKEVGFHDTTPVYLTGTDKATLEGRELRLGKALLVSRLQVLLQGGLIHLPKTPEAEALIQELLNYEIRVSDDAHAEFGAFKVGSHDDLATALGLAVWQEPKPAPAMAQREISIEDYRRASRGVARDRRPQRR